MAAPQAPGQKRKKKKSNAGQGHTQGAPVLSPVSQGPVPAVALAVQPAPTPVVLAQDAKKIKSRCWKCEVDTHATKDCTVPHYCYICDNSKHPLKKCPTLKLPKLSVFVAWQGNHDTMFSLFPSSVHKAQLAPSGSPTTLVTVEGTAATTKQVEAQIARMCPSPSWV